MYSIARKNLLAYTFFIFLPFFSLIAAIINYKEKYAKNIVWLFTCFYGFTFVISPGSDSEDYKYYFSYLYKVDYSLLSFIQAVKNGEEARGDYYEPVLSFIISRFTDDYRFLFLAFAFVFGYFFSRSIWIIVDNFSNKLKPLSVILIFFLVITLPIWNINGVRFYTACMIFCYATLNFYMRGNKKSILLILLTPLVHFSFLFAVGIFLLYLGLRLLRIKKTTYIGIFVFGAFLSNFDISYLLQYSYLFEDNMIVSDRIETYTNAEYVEKYFDKSERSWFMKIYTVVKKFINIFIVVFLLFFNYAKVKKYGLEDILYLGIILYSATAVFGVIPSMLRFLTLPSYFLTATLILFNQKSQSSYWLNLFSPVLAATLIFLSLIQFRIGWQSMNITLLFSNPMIAFFFENTVSISNFYEGNV